MKFMTCTEFRKLASSYLDHQVAPRQQGALTRHLTGCEACQLYLAQLRTVSDGLGRLPHAPLPAELLAETLVALDRLQHDHEPYAVKGLVNWTLGHSRVVSAVAGFLITILCYGGILGQLKPIPYLPAFTQSASIRLSSSQYDRVNGRVASEPGTASYSFPRVKQSGYVDTPLAKMDATPIVVIALVHSDGRASLVEVLKPASSPELVEQVQGALRNLRFRPAMTGGRPVPTQLVLLMDRVDVRG